MARPYNPVEAFHLLTKLPPDELADAAMDVVSRASLADFIRYAWDVQHDGEPLKWERHIACIGEHLEALWAHEIEWLIINIEPGVAKSLICSVDFPSWVWLKYPAARFLCSSANDIVTFRDARRHRDLVESDWYRRLFLPDWGLSRSQKATGSFANSAGGERVSRTVNAGITGSRPHCKIIDDPNNPLGSADDHDKVNTWLKDVLLKRRILGRPDCLCLIQQRIAENDASGFLLERRKKPKTVHLMLPNEFDPPRSFHSIVTNKETGKPWEDWRTEEGELLCPQLLNREETDREKEDPATYSAQYQQDPTPASGIIFLRSMFKRWSFEPQPNHPEWPTYELPAKFDYSIVSCDPNNLKDEHKNTDNTDYCPIQLWGVLGQNIYLRTEQRQKLSVGAAVNAIIEFLDHHNDISEVLIEKSASGPTMIGTLRALRGLAHEVDLPEEYQFFRPWTVQGESKPQRARGVVSIVADGRVFIPNEQEFGEMEYWLAEITGFPRRRRDDRVDCMTQALKFIESKPYG
jgi:predicted phage terminase large subunit-like protein